MKTLLYNEDFILIVSFRKSEAESKAEQLKSLTNVGEVLVSQNKNAPALYDVVFGVAGLQDFDKINAIIKS